MGLFSNLPFSFLQSWLLLPFVTFIPPVQDCTVSTVREGSLRPVSVSGRTLVAKAGLLFLILLAESLLFVFTEAHVPPLLHCSQLHFVGFFVNFPSGSL